MTLAPSVETRVQLQLPFELRLTPEQFALVCRANPEAVLELAADGQLIAMTPTGGETGQRNLALGALLWQAVRTSRLPLRLFDSSTGFQLPDGSVLSPDAALIQQHRWDGLTLDQRRGFPPLCPDLVVELASPSDQGPRGVQALRQKMVAYRRNGAQIGWLLLPDERAVEIWQSGDAPPERLAPAEALCAAPVFPALSIDLSEVWQA